MNAAQLQQIQAIEFLLEENLLGSFMLKLSIDSLNDAIAEYQVTLDSQSETNGRQPRLYFESVSQDDWTLPRLQAALRKRGSLQARLAAVQENWRRLDSIRTHLIEEASHENI